ncbi:DUF4262 domain-containing protein [Rhabdothermincola salaria]|uniref:DUF4262 domain-containing protein n=1 Tax=Rhabdothermincola salaria TaxID=2903142 RepID=UPI001E3A7018|nr:DUF4262 domain-containing protein [Rhabdothermincola salaria]MCD9624241.1 DUF4262 domain-containing protein [Rhabdothermincola salaria]
MCIMCEGASHDDVLFNLHGHVLRHGWVLQAVWGEPPDRPGFVYSIGLSAGFDHPELVVVGYDTRVGGAVINELGESVRLGRRFQAGDHADLEGGRVTFGTVHPVHLERGLVASWVNYYGSLGELPPVEFLQVILPPLPCSCGESHTTPLLAEPSDSVGLA